MKRNKDKRVRGRFLTMLLGKYALFSATMVLLMLAVMCVSVLNVSEYQNTPKLKDLMIAFEDTSASDYADIDVENILGADSYVQILDRDGKVTYSSNGNDAGEQYTEDELGYITSYSTYAIVTVQPYNRKDGRQDRVIESDQINAEGDIEYSMMMVVDNDLNILYSSEDTKETQLSQREYELLTQSGIEDYALSKGEFKDADGNSTTLLAFIQKGAVTKIKRFQEAFLAIILGFIGVYFLLLLVFSFWVSRRIKKPLAMLSTAMTDISSGGMGNEVEYTGPKEFVEIVDNFNEMSKELYDAQEKNRNVQEGKQKMIADISHDLKTPITVIKGYSKAICDGLVEADEQQKYLEIIYQKSEQLTELINEFHDYAKIGHPDNRFEMERVDICEYTREYYAKRYAEFDIGGYGLEVAIPEEAIYVSLDPVRFKRVYDNITANFFKYNKPEATFFCTIQVPENNCVQIILADDGEGIPIDIKESAFEPFVVGEKARNSQGTGLGLPMVKKIVDIHEGSIELVKLPEEGIGTRFIINLKKY